MSHGSLRFAIWSCDKVSALQSVKVNRVLPVAGHSGRVQKEGSLFSFGNYCLVFFDRFTLFFPRTKNKL